ncbi:UNVERIFIED_CONTAM: hypothetical protein Sradi_5851000 [Sesamum radiatum]|uniref:Uncharacterized protein n=1 Tax=Sesamum radiatum TaxID=300843 RepID=A0AAW2KR85_SESRA
MPPVLSTTIVTHTEATAEGGRGSSPTIGISTTRKRKLIGADDSDEADDDGDGLPLRS